ncbi:hypothetical protein MO387_16790 [Shewanella sp. N2AIL]|uniref:hypothetical protein n=1 Tax=Shewanella sp. N2AIL TaxID=2926851 RepID=UPI001F593716|nr:hypothetical protein [Shewanella sp. N2AIL]MCI2964733.1 hypothetical protein [Shewanella sp. N2AIL]
MSFFNFWTKSGAVITLQDVGISSEEARSIIGNTPKYFIDDVKLLTKKLNRKQKNIALAWGALILFQEKNGKYQHLVKIQMLSKGFRFHILNDFTSDELKIVYHQVMQLVYNVLGKKVTAEDLMTENEMVNSFDLNELKEEFL